MEKLRRRSVLRILNSWTRTRRTREKPAGMPSRDESARLRQLTSNTLKVRVPTGLTPPSARARARFSENRPLGPSSREQLSSWWSHVSHPFRAVPVPLPCRTRRSSRGFAASARMLSVRRWPRARNSRDSTTRLACSKFARNSTRNSRTATRDAPSCSAARARASPPTARRASPPPPNASPPPPPTVRTALAPPRPLAPSRPSVPTPRAWTTTTRATRVASRSRVVEGHLDATPPPPTAPPRAPPRTPGGTASTRPPPWTPTNAVADARAMPPSRPRPRRPIPSPRTSPPRLSRRIPPRRTT